MMLQLDNAPMRAIRLALLVGALIFSASAWADPGVTDPNPCSEGPEADSASGGSSSFAAGCDAEVNGDGSVAIGHNASTELFEVGEERIVANGHDAEINGDGSVAIGHDAEIFGSESSVEYRLSSTSYRVNKDQERPTHAYRFSNPDSETVDYVFSNGDVNEALKANTIRNSDGTITTVEILMERGLTDTEYKDILDWLKMKENGTDLKNEYDQAVANLSFIDIGASVDTVGQGIDIRTVPAPVNNAVAVGNGATVRGDGGVALGGGAKVGLDNDGDPDNGEESAGTNGIAIGNGATVTGDNGIAIGAGVTAGENEIVIGTSDHSAMIAGVDIKRARADIDTNAAGIMANTAGITANTGRITANEGNIMDNASAIAGNAAAIADFNDRLMGVDERVKQVAAMSAALSAVPNVVSGDGDFFLGVGFGNSSGEQGIAVGVSARFGPKKNIVFNAGAASAGDETSARVGVGFVW